MRCQLEPRVGSGGFGRGSWVVSDINQQTAVPPPLSGLCGCWEWNNEIAGKSTELSLEDAAKPEI